MALAYGNPEKAGIEWLEEGNHLNDVNFWMYWISHQEYAQSTEVYIFTTHFYTKLAEEGVQPVSWWTINKGIDIFTKKMKKKDF